MFYDQTLRFPCDILFGTPRDTPSSPTNSEARLESAQASAGEQVKLSRELNEDSLVPSNIGYPAINSTSYRYKYDIVTMNYYGFGGYSGDRMCFSMTTTELFSDIRVRKHSGKQSSRVVRCSQRNVMLD
ncbi:hypothetical protein AVEN_29070-1 [Araneus ventricosus]|uniref:Uncharacterized protein n=1 Tax=Araneus ventricosus TaxID=182803 RepID=A0A4Y2AK87_ARAVE|nr:hypothetical protein AVEN_29070-1 [Araneus ventricosus]